MLAQLGFWMVAANFDGIQTRTRTEQIANRDIFAEIALTDIVVLGEEIYLAQAWISQIVSDRGVENLNFERLTFRNNVTSITFRLEVVACRAVVRCMMNVWS